MTVLSIRNRAAQMVQVLLSVYEKHPSGEVTVVTLAEENRIAKSMGLTYGKYKALSYEAERKASEAPRKPARKSRRRYTDEQAFAMWQAGKNDCEIGAALGVSRQIIQRWRDTMELPSTAKEEIDTEHYHLVKTPAGTFVVYGEDY